MKVFDTVFHRWLRIPYTLPYEVHHPKGKRTVVFIHGIGNNHAAWKPVIKKLPSDIRIITVDLLGFGAAPTPQWATYNARTQARSVQATLLKIGFKGKVTLVGHSLGSLVAVEMARRYPIAIKQLVLCSPPFYQPDDTKLFALAPERVLRSIYHKIIDNQNTFVELSALAMKYKLVNPAFSVTKDNVATYMATLKTMILNQTTLQDVARLNMPVYIIRGALDMFVIARNINNLKKLRTNITSKTIVAGHEVQGTYAQAVACKVTELMGK